jgi:hypothetical protein
MQGNYHISPPIEFYCLLGEDGKLLPIDLIYNTETGDIWIVPSNHNICPAGKKKVLTQELEAAVKSFQPKKRPRRRVL